MTLWDLVAGSFSAKTENVVAVKFYDSRENPPNVVPLTYKHLLEICDSVVEVLQNLGVSKEVICIHFDDDQAEIVGYLPVLLAAVRINCPFHFLSNCDFKEALAGVDSRVLVTSKTFDEAAENIRISDTIVVALFKNNRSRSIARSSRSRSSTPSESPDLRDACYLILTSGTTGRSKLVTATTSSVRPNILDLCDHLRPAASDQVCQVSSCPLTWPQVFLASPPTFDPHLLDIFLSLAGGSTLLVLPSSCKAGGGGLYRDLFVSNSVSIIQVRQHEQGSAS